MNQYTTPDIALASYLSYKGFHLIGIQGYGPVRRKQFVFEGKKDIEKEVDKFYAKEASVCPLRYYQELKMIKQRLYQNEYDEPRR